MNRICRFLVLVLSFLLLSGCSLQTLDDLYQVPKRSDEYNDLQEAIDKNLKGLEFCAPLSGDNLQTIQMADLDGDSVQECLLFAKGTEEKPLQILIFAMKNGEYALADTIESYGTAFDMVQYARIDDQPGVELIVGCQISQDVARSVGVYGFRSGKAVSLMSANYTRFLSCDLMDDDRSELMVFHSEENSEDHGLAQLYRYSNGKLSIYDQANLSGSAERIKRIVPGQLRNGENAVFVDIAVDRNSVTTDALAVVNGKLTNLADAEE